MLPKTNKKTVSYDYKHIHYMSKQKIYFGYTPSSKTLLIFNIIITHIEKAKLELFVLELIHLKSSSCAGVTAGVTVTEKL